MLQSGKPEHNLNKGKVRMKQRFVFFLLVCLLLTSCLGAADVGTPLSVTSSGFSESMRWSDYQTAGIYMQAQARELFLEQFVEDEDLHIVDSSAVKVDLHEQEGWAEVVYQLDYYRLPSSTIKKWRWTQRWVYVREKATKPGVWLIENGPPALPWNE
jgi:hypothetical protein